MKFRPNLYANPDPPSKKNDLYRKFSIPFQNITAKEFNAFGMYHKDAYISVAPDIEEEITDMLNSTCDQIVSISGFTGIGKTYLLLYTLKNFYDSDEIKPNYPYIFKIEDGMFDLVLYCSHENYHSSLLQKVDSLQMARVSAMSDCVLSINNQEVSKCDLDNYVNHTRPEAKYYSNEDKQYVECISRLIIALHNNKINNIVLIFDDLESLEEDIQFKIIKDFLALYEMIKNNAARNYVCKFILSVRTTTFNSIYKQDFYNTHRHDTRLLLDKVPFLNEIFSKRFDLIQENYSLLRNSGNKDTWIEAKNILMRLSERVDHLYSKMLFELNNNNISNSINDFIEILKNRRWTQQNMNPTAIFKIEEYQYYINDINILRVLCMGENSVYFHNNIHSLRCILYNPGNMIDDFFSYYILLYFNKKYESYRPYNSLETIFSDINDIKQIFIELFTQDSMEKQRVKIASCIEAICNYFNENRIIKSDDAPNSHNVRFILMPRGRVLFSLFFGKSILLQIFRDSFLLDSDTYKNRCTKDLSQDELFSETLQYIDQYYRYENSILSSISTTGKIEMFVEAFGEEIISLYLVHAMGRSIKDYYKDSNIPKDILDKYSSLNNDISQFNKDICS